MIKVALLYGGTSLEHEVSLMSAKNVRRALEAAQFEVVPIFITKKGEWQLEKEEGNGRELITKLPELCDVVFPVTHGTYGEDGGLQGLLSILGVPYAGCDVIASAACFDKEITKRVLHDNGLPVIDYEIIQQVEGVSIDELTATLGKELFIKPARQGSSVGVSRATTQEELQKAVHTALQHGKKALVERASSGREIEIAVLEEKGKITVSPPGEIVVEDGFYDYDNKYFSDKTELKIPVELTDAELKEGQALAEQAFRALNCTGMARIDFFLEDSKWIINELNTIPGFADLSVYPKLFEAGGISQPELVKRLVMATLT